MIFDPRTHRAPLAAMLEYVFAARPRCYYFCIWCFNYVIPDKTAENCEACGAKGKYLRLWVRIDTAYGYYYSPLEPEREEESESKMLKQGSV